MRTLKYWLKRWFCRHKNIQGISYGQVVLGSKTYRAVIYACPDCDYSKQAMEVIK